MKSSKLEKWKQLKSEGYVTDTPEAVIWHVMTTRDYKNRVLEVIKPGERTDTIGAIAGGLTGVLCGVGSIPTEWLWMLKKKDYIGKSVVV